MTTREATLRTLAYFDLFDFPPTTLELWKYLHGAAHSFSDVRRTLEILRVEEAVDTAYGFWFHKNRAETVLIRRERYPIAERKYRRARAAARLLRAVPGIRMIAVANTLAWSHARDGSDIDLFIVVSPGTLWKSRMCAVLPFALMGNRPRPGHERDTICLSFFATETALDFRSLAMVPEDPYLTHWLASLVPLYDPDGLIEAVADANKWVQDVLPNVWSMRTAFRRRLGGTSVTSDICNSIRPGIIESCARGLQMMWFPHALKERMNVHPGVVVTDELLKLHVNDRRTEIAAQYIERCRAFGIT